MSNDSKIRIVIYGPLVIGLLCFYANYLYIKLDENPKVALPTPKYEIKYETCNRFCSVVKSYYCREWIDIANNNMCQYICDAYYDLDSLEYSYEWNSISKCAISSSSAEELRNCKVTCTVMEEM